jgi:cardiolipin synthase
MSASASHTVAVIDLSWWPIAALTIEFLIRLLLIGFILLRRQPRAATNVAWITVILLLPVAGMIGYLLVGEVRLGRRRLERHRRIVEQISDPSSFHPVRAAAEQTPIPEAFQPVESLAETIGNNSAVGGNVLQLIANTDLFIDSLVNDINEAESHCHLLFYLFLDDHSGRRVARALMDAAARGVAARLLVDAVGSRPFTRSALIRELREAGVSVVEALPTNALRLLFARLDLRNHRKIAVIDGRVGYMGSHNLADAEFAIKPKYAPWVDAMMRVHGPAVYDLQVLFIEDWYLDTDESLAALLEDAPPVDPAGMAVQVMGSGPNSYPEALRQVSLTAFHTAREELLLTSPYFVPDLATAMAIKTAALRGVATTIVVPARNDSPLVAAASRSHYEPMLAAGVRVFEYERGLLHAKTISIDRELAMISSANLDRRSFELNFEVSTVVYDSDFASELRFLQTSYLEDSREVHLGAWRRRGWPRRLWHNTAGMVSPLL